MKPFKMMVFIGRFQPFHLGHLTVVQQAMTQADHLLILCGSCFQPPNLRNPWDFEMRQRLMMASVPEVYHARLTLHPMADLWYQDALWANRVETVIRQHMAKLAIDDDAQVACIGFAKDAQSSHLSMLPAFPMIAVQQPPDIHATRIRKACFDDNVEAIASDMVPAAHAVLKDALQAPSWQDLLVTHQYVQQEKSGWQHTPYPPVFTTVDAVVFHRGHVLLVRRKGMPGQGLLALPGGYIEIDETLQDACWRELHEETTIDMTKATFMQHCIGQDVFDHPHRAEVGRVITHAFVFCLPDTLSPPKLQAGDDAAEAFWCPWSKVALEDFAFDHYFILDKCHRAHWPDATSRSQA